MAEERNNPVPLPDFLARAFSRPRLPDEDPAVGMARAILEECRASEPDENSIWERHGALVAAVQMLLDLIHGREGQE